MAETSLNDATAISLFLSWLRDNASFVFGGGLLAMIVRGTMQVSDFKSAQQAHELKLGLHDQRLDKIDAKVLATELKVAELPTKDDLRDLGEGIRGEVRSGFGQIYSLLQNK
jgi:hypothetical protein